MSSDIAELAAHLDLEFTDLSLLRQALVHSSHSNERPSAGPPNERLEFLGDAVVGVVISEELYARHPDEDEGSLTTRRAAIVSARAMARIADRLSLGEYLLLGQGATAAGEGRRASVLAGAFEAVCGAIYLEFGFSLTRQWLLDVCAPELNAETAAATLKAPKSQLQELSYNRDGRAPHYRLVSAEGPDHDRHYVVEVLIAGEVMGHGEGRNRREAETEAAREALVALTLDEVVG
ncbi:MAG TPA: ribonuclease III [Candidatus Limnocylindrales bacterium]|jgi:ribonuclease III|nr:ribonuclease III [Candidatus Limnocylindrales bacterium]